MIVEIILSAITIIVSIIVSVAVLAYWLGRKFERIEGRFEQIDERFKRIEERFEGRFKQIEGRFAGIERTLRSLALASAEVQRMVLDFLSLKGLLERSESEYLMKRAEGLFRVYVTPLIDPLSEEELKFVREFLSRDVDLVTIEEAERAYELGKRIFVEGDERGFILAMAAAYARGYLVSREVRKRKCEERKSEA